MVNGSFASARIYTDFGGLAELRAGAREQSPQARKEVARQFEAIFIQIMLKSMRQAGETTGSGESDQVKFYQQMFDQQVALELANSHGMGLAKVFEQQLGGEAAAQREATGSGMPERRHFAPVASAMAASAQREADYLGPVQEAAGETAWPPADPAQFIRKLWPVARRVAGKLGVDPEVILAQAALESGWGRRTVPGSEGSSFNLFGIKADGRWRGERVTVSTLEYRDGVAVRETAAFRSYASPAESLEDYVEFIRGNPRYRGALEKVADPSAYLRELQRAGYATDPRYAEKIEGILASRTFSETVAQLKGS